MPRFAAERKENILKSYFSDFSAYILSGNINAKFWLFWLLKIWCVSTGPLECHVGQTDHSWLSLNQECFPMVTQLLLQRLVSASLSFKKQTDHRYKQKKNPPELRTCYITQSKASWTSLYQEKGGRWKPESFLGEAAAETNVKLDFYFKSGQDRRLTAPCSCQLSIIMNPRNNSREQPKNSKEVKRKAEWLEIPGLEELTVVALWLTEGNTGPAFPSSQPSNRWLLR